MANGGGGWGKGDNSNFLQYFAATLGKNSNHYLPWQWRRGPRGCYHHPRENVHGPLRHQRGRKLQWPHGENRQGLRGTHVVCPEERKWERCLVSVSLVVSSCIFGIRVEKKYQHCQLAKTFKIILIEKYFRWVIFLLTFLTSFSYGMALDNDGTSDNGYMKCKLGGTFVGECHKTYIVLYRHWKLGLHQKTFLRG